MIVLSEKDELNFHDEKGKESLLPELYLKIKAS
jgi:hypothetical protein